MINKNFTLGKHENILFAEFGYGDIAFTKARLENDKHESMLLFHNQSPRPIGDVTNEWEGKTSDELPPADFILRFKNPESLNALIHSLSELQKEVIKGQLKDNSVSFADWLLNSGWTCIDDNRWAKPKDGSIELEEREYSTDEVYNIWTNTIQK